MKNNLEIIQIVLTGQGGPATAPLPENPQEKPAGRKAAAVLLLMLY